MKILWICGLPQAVAASLHPGWAKGRAAWSWIMGHLPPPGEVELHIACPVTEGPWRSYEVQWDHATFHVIRCLPGRLWSGFLIDPLWYLPLHRRLNPDVVHGWGTEDSFSITASFLNPRRSVVQVQGLINEYLDHLPPLRRLRYIAWRERRTLKRARHVFVESRYSQDMALPYCGPSTDIRIVDHPLRPEFLSAPLSSGAGHRILFVGTLDRRKGALDAVRAFAAGAPQPWELCLIGKGSPEFHAAAETLAREAGVAGRVRFVPEADVHEVVEAMQRSAVFLLPSYMDTGPTALKEALAMGLWPIGYDNSGPAELIRRFDFGSLVKTGDIDGLTRVLREKLETGSQIKQDMRNAMAKKVRAALGRTAVWDALISAYKDIIRST
jgi:glycosyltransferase involved in cell wall biosynthesis